MENPRPGLVRMRSRTLRLALAATLAIVGAFWFAIDFSSSHAANPGAIVPGVSGVNTETAALRAPEVPADQPWLSPAAFSTLVTGGAIPDPPFAPVLAVAGLYIFGRMSFKRWSMRR